MSITFGAPEKPTSYFKGIVSGEQSSGKTTALRALARGLAGAGKVACANTELGGTAFLEHKDFMQFDWQPPYTVEAATDIINAAVEQGFTVLFFDSGSSLWEDEGGTLDQVDEAARARVERSRSSHTDATVGDWKKAKQKNKKFWKDVVLPAPIHILFSIRAEEGLVPIEGTRGDFKKARKLNWDKKRRFDPHVIWLLAPYDELTADGREPHTVIWLRDRIRLRRKIGETKYLDEAYGAKIAAHMAAEGAPSTPGKPTTAMECFVRKYTEHGDKVFLDCDNGIRLRLGVDTASAHKLGMDGGYTVKATCTKVGSKDGVTVYDVSKLEVV